MGPAQRAQLRRLYAGYRHIPLADVSAAGAAQAARILDDGQEWAEADFMPAGRAGRALADEFQDGAGTGIFSRPRGGNWQVAGPGVEPLGCAAVIPAAVRQLWGLAKCAAAGAASRPRVAVPDSTAAALASLAEGMVGVSDNPSETVLDTGQVPDCNPFTAMMAPGASKAGCKTDPTFHITDASEYWCADFTKWVWEQAGVTSDLSTLNPGAASFYAWGLAQGESMPQDATDPQVGDAVVFYFGAANTTFALHVGIVAAINPGGTTMDLVNGDFLGATNVSVQADNDIPISVSGFTKWATSTWGTTTTSKGQTIDPSWVYVSPQLSTVSTASATVGTAPATAVDQYGNEFVYWRNPADGGLEELFYQAATQSWRGPLEIPRMGPLGSSPTVAVGTQTADGYAEQYVFWRGQDGSLREARWDGSWFGPRDLGDGPLASAPAAGADDEGNVAVLWESSTAGHGLEETQWNGSSWGRPYQVSAGSTGMGPLGSAPAVAVTPGGDQYVFWRGTNGQLWEAWWDGSWNGPSDLGDGQLGSAPTAGIDGSGNEYVLWAGAGGGLDETIWDGSSWEGPSQVPGMGPLGSAPAVAVGSDGDQYVFWEGTGNGDLWDGSWNGSSWYGPQDLGGGPLS